MNTSSSSLGAFLIFVGFAVVIVNYLRNGNMSGLWERGWTQQRQVILAEQQNQSNPRASKRWPAMLGLVMLILAGLWISVSDKSSKTVQSTLKADRDEQPNIVTPEQTAVVPQNKMLQVYFTTIANATPSLTQDFRTVATACGDMSATPSPSDLNRCGRGIDIIAASVGALQKQMSSVSVPDCLRNVDATLRHALDLFSDGYSTIRKGISAQSMTIVYSAMPVLEVANQELKNSTKLLEAVMPAGTCRSQ
jgi:hypothetical protein